MTKGWFVHDNFVATSVALTGFSKAEGELPEWRGKREAVRSKSPAIFQNVDRIYKVAVVLQRRELRVKRWLREQVLAIFGYPDGPFRQCSIPCG